MNVMKLKYLLVISAAAMFAFACEKPVDPENPDKDKQEEINGDDDKPVDAEPLTQAQQKKRLEEIGLELLDYADLANWGDSFTAIAKFSMLINDEQYDKSAFSNIGELGERQEQANYKGEDDNYGRYCNYSKPYDHKMVSSYTTQLSRACGKFVLNQTKKAWEYTADSSLSAEAEMEGKTLLAKAAITEYPDPLLTNESYQKDETSWVAYKTGPAMYGHVVHNDQNDYDEWVYDSRTNAQNETEYHFYNPITSQDLGWYPEYVFWGENSEAFRTMVDVPAGERKFTENHSEYIYLPKTVKATFTEDTAKAFDFNLDIDYKGAKAGVFDPTADQLSLSGDVLFGGYLLTFDKIGYLQDDSEISYKLTNGETSLLKMDIKAKGFKLAAKENKYENSYKDETFTNSYVSSHTDYEIDAMPGEMEVSLDLLGKIQLKGSCDFEKLYAISDKINESRQDEALFKSWVGQAEQNFSLDVFFDRSINRSAHIGLEPIKDGEYWTVVPVIRFEDGSAYALFEVFFNEIDFADLITAEGNWQKSVEEFLNQYFEKHDSQEAQPVNPNTDQPK